MVRSLVATGYLRNRDAYRDAAQDWVILEGCFGGKIRPSDIDGIVERNGHFLVLEKKPSGYEFRGGQALLFSRLSALPRFTVLILRGDGQDCESMQVWGQPTQPCTLEAIRDFCHAWYDVANGAAP